MEKTPYGIEFRKYDRGQWSGKSNLGFASETIINTVSFETVITLSAITLVLKFLCVDYTYRRTYLANEVELEYYVTPLMVDKKK